MYEILLLQTIDYRRVVSGVLGIKKIGTDIKTPKLLPLKQQKDGASFQASLKHLLWDVLLDPN